jgi:hypothetical protein
MKRVTGIGGIFFKAKDAPALQAWYKKHLGIDVKNGVAQRSRGPTRKASLLSEQRSVMDDATQRGGCATK